MQAFLTGSESGISTSAIINGLLLLYYSLGVRSNVFFELPTIDIGISRLKLRGALTLGL